MSADTYTRACDVQLHAAQQLLVYGSTHRYSVCVYSTYIYMHRYTVIDVHMLNAQRLIQSLNSRMLRK